MQVRHFLHLCRRWWKEFWGSDDLYVRGVRLGTRTALSLTDSQIFHLMHFVDKDPTCRDDFDYGWMAAMIAELKKRGWEDESITTTMGW